MRLGALCPVICLIAGACGDPAPAIISFVTTERQAWWYEPSDFDYCAINIHWPDKADNDRALKTLTVDLKREPGAQNFLMVDPISQDLLVLIRRSEDGNCPLQGVADELAGIPAVEASNAIPLSKEAIDADPAANTCAVEFEIDGSMDELARKTRSLMLRYSGIFQFGAEDDSVDLNLYRNCDLAPGELRSEYENLVRRAPFLPEPNLSESAHDS